MPGRARFDGYAWVLTISQPRGRGSELRLAHPLCLVFRAEPGVPVGQLPWQIRAQTCRQAFGHIGIENVAGDDAAVGLERAAKAIQRQIPDERGVIGARSGLAVCRRWRGVLAAGFPQAAEQDRHQTHQQLVGEGQWIGE